MKKQLTDLEYENLIRHGSLITDQIKRMINYSAEYVGTYYGVDLFLIKDLPILNNQSDKYMSTIHDNGY